MKRKGYVGKEKVGGYYYETGTCKFAKRNGYRIIFVRYADWIWKTYSVLDFMVDNYDSPEFKDKKIFFVTTPKKNLPDKELREHFAKRGKAGDYDKYCLRIDANVDMVVEKLEELYRARKIPPTITMKQEFKDLHGSVKLLNEYGDKKCELKGTSRDIINVLCKSAEDVIRKQQEGAFLQSDRKRTKAVQDTKGKVKEYC